MATDFDDLPHDIAAEQYTLAAMMNDPAGVLAAAEIVEPQDFYRPAHQVLFHTLIVMTAAQEPLSLPTVANWLAREGDIAALGGKQRGFLYVHDIVSIYQPWQTAAHHARIVRDHAVRRRLVLASDRMRQRAFALDAATADIAADCQREVDDAVAFSTEGDMGAGQLLTAESFAGRAGSKPEPLIDGLLNRMDRVVVVAGEGVGKSVLALQIAAAGAVGVHPFDSRYRFAPIRVLVVDLENPDYLLASNIAMVMRGARYYGDPGDRLQILSRPRGLDLRKPGNAHLLGSLIRQAQPDLICAGPIYKMFADTGERSDHTVVTEFWDAVRDRHRCALWLETHAPLGMFGKRPMRPAGSGLWQKWPEFGLTLVRKGNDESGNVDVGRFRGGRERGRVWPLSLTVNVGGWPWSANYPAGTFLEDPG